MIALPKVVYHYSFVIFLILIPAICDLWNKTEDKLQKNVLLVISLGIAMTQWQAIATYYLTNNLMSHAIPGIGLLVVMSGIVLYKILGFYKHFPRHKISYS